jgi:Cu+-exporting ATPase
MAQFSGTLDDGRITFDSNKPNAASLATTKAKDVVCGMLIDPRDAKTAHFAGHTYYFCSPECQIQFEADPNKYAA